MTAATSQQGNPPAHVQIFQLLNGYFVSGVIACVAQLGIPDLLEQGPKSAGELATQIKAEPGPLYRLMRASACIGVFSEGPDGKFSQTPLSAVLCTNATPSLRTFSMMHSREWHARGWAALEYCVRSGKQSMERNYGAHIFEYFKQHPEESELFNQSMTDLSTITAPAIADAYSFSGINSIVDIAGGHGHLLATILSRNPHMKGTLFDLPHVIEGAKGGSLKPLLDRCKFASGDMFTFVPNGADAYIMKHIIHDWPDDVSIRILKACRAAVNPGGKLLVVDSVIPPGNGFDPSKFLDIQMLIFPGGRERTEKEFRELFAASGWNLSRVIPTQAAESIVEGIPA